LETLVLFQTCLLNVSFAAFVIFVCFVVSLLRLSQNLCGKRFTHSKKQKRWDDLDEHFR
jgi:hypothetical protein